MALLSELKGAWRVYRDRRKDLRNEKAEAVELVYTDKLGNRWYAFTNPLRIPGIRAVNALVATRRSDLNFTRADASQLATDMRKHANDGDFVAAMHLLSIFQDRLDWACEEKSLLDVAKVYYLINEEPQGDMLPRWQQEKEAAWEADPDCAAFFLREAYYLTRGFSELSASDIPTYLATRRERIRTGSNAKPPAGPGKKGTATGSTGK